MNDSHFLIRRAHITKSIAICCLGLVVCSAFRSVASKRINVQGRERILFNQDWRFKREDPIGTGDALSYSKTRDWLVASGNGLLKSVRPKPVRPPGNLGSGVSYTQIDFDDHDWRTLDLPHDWGIEGEFKQEYPGETGKLPWWGVGWYRKHFLIPSEDAPK